MKPALNRIIVYTGKMDEMIAFYARHFGYREQRLDGDRIVELLPPQGGAILMLHPAARGQKQGQSLVKLVFDVSDVPAALKALKDGGVETGPVHKADGYAFANFKDPSGNPVSIFEPHLPARAAVTAPPLARLIAAIGTPAFAEGLTDAAAEPLKPDAAAFILFRSTAQPAVLVDRLMPAERGHLYGDYLSGVYLLSPFYRASLGLKQARAARILDIAPEGFTQSEYHRRYFALIGVADMLGLLIPARDAVAFLSFSRGAGRPRFSTRETRSVTALLPVLAAAVARHEAIAGSLAGRRGGREPKPAPATRHAGLTAREAEVVNLILEGHSARAVAERLRISLETVRVHRRNVYEKLGVSSQAELFHWFLDTRV